MAHMVVHMHMHMFIFIIIAAYDFLTMVSSLLF